jgi:regulatory protein
MPAIQLRLYLCTVISSMGNYKGASKTRQSIEKYCAYQDRCQFEVEQKLKALGCNAEEVENELIHLISEGFINEERFAKSFAGGHFRTKAWGRTLIRKHLQAKRVSEVNIQTALRTEIPMDDYIETLQRLIDKKISAESFHIKNLSDRAKLFNYLYRKGYESDLIQAELENHTNKNL